MTRSDVSRPTLVLVPGVLGSRLRDPRDRRLIWGSVRALYTRERRMALALPLEPAGARAELVPNGVVRRMVKGIYTRFLRRFRDWRVVNAAYDWRCSHARAAERLRARLREVSGPVAIVAHSSGGLVVDLALDGCRADVRRLAYVGYPILGTMNALRFLVEGCRLGPGAVLDAALLFSMPSVFELLPEDGGALGDIWEPRTWVEGAWSAFHPRERPLAETLYGADRLDERLRRHLETVLASARELRRTAAARRDGRRIETRVYVSSDLPTVADARIEAAGPCFDVMEAGDGSATLHSCVDALPRNPDDRPEIRRFAGRHRYALKDKTLLADLQHFFEAGA